MERVEKTGFQSAEGRAAQRNACLTHWMDKRFDILAQYPYPKLVITGDNDEVFCVINIRY